MNIKDIEAEREQHIEEFPVLVHFKDVFPEEIAGLQPKKYLDFSIELTPGSVSASEAPSHKSAPELVEIELQV